MSKYSELKDEYYHHHFDGIDYVFGDKQLKEYFERTGYTEDDIKSGKLVTEGYGSIGTKEAFAKKQEYYEKWKERVRTECNPDEIFTDEWWNHECGYTYDYNPAINLTRCYFPDYTPKKSLTNKLQKQFDKCNS